MERHEEGYGICVSNGVLVMSMEKQGCGRNEGSGGWHNVGLDDEKCR